MKRISESVPGMYGKGGNLEAYKLLDEEGVMEDMREVYQLLKANNLFPQDLDGFTFLSPSSNTGVREIALATILDEAIEQGEFRGKPHFIASDAFGQTTEEGNFVPGFDPSLKPDLPNVAFNFLSAQAEQLPVASGTVSMIYDRLGAVWYSVNNYYPSEERSETKSWQKEWEEEEDRENRSEAQQVVKKLLASYAEKLEPEGVIVLDAAEEGAPPSTGEYLEWAFEDIAEDLAGFEIAETIKRKTAAGKEKIRVRSQVGFEVEVLGEGENRLYVLKLSEFSRLVEPVLISTHKNRF